MTVNSDRALIVFVKNPVVGRVKTRLAATIGEQKAYDIYIKLLSHAIEVAAAADSDLILCYSDFVPEQDAWSSIPAHRSTQKGKDLGACMHNALADTLEIYKSAVLIGSDCGQLTTKVLDSAFDSLSHVDAILGPALDGGYYLVGSNRPVPDVFEDIDWSTDQVLYQSLTRLLSTGLSFALGATMRDVDTIADWQALLSMYPSFGM